MSDDPVAPAESVQVQGAEPALKRRIRKRAIVVPLVLAAMIPIGWGASVVASPMMAHAQMKSDLAEAGQQVQAAKDDAGKYLDPVFLPDRYEATAHGEEIPEGSFGPVLLSDRTLISSTPLGDDQFCLTGYTDAVFYEDALFYSSSTGKVSKDPSGCLNLEGDGDTYQCLPQSKNLIEYGVNVLESPGYREAVSQHEKELDRLTKEGASMGAFEAASMRHAKNPAVEEHFKSYLEGSTERMGSNDALATLSFHEADEREEFGATTPEFAKQAEVSNDYLAFVSDEANFDEEGSFLPGKEEQAQKLYDQAEDAVQEYVEAICG